MPEYYKYPGAEKSDLYSPHTGYKYEPYVRVSKAWLGQKGLGFAFDPGRKYGGIKNPERFRPKGSEGDVYRKPGQQGMISFHGYEETAPHFAEFRRGEGTVWDRR